MRRLNTLLAVFTFGLAMIAHTDGMSAADSVRPSTEAQSTTIDHWTSVRPSQSSAATVQAQSRSDALASQYGAAEQSPATDDPIKSFACGACSLLNYNVPVKVCPFCHIDDEPNPIN